MSLDTHTIKHTKPLATVTPKNVHHTGAGAPPRSFACASVTQPDRPRRP